jgi:hypothetical protein
VWPTTPGSGAKLQRGATGRPKILARLAGIATPEARFPLIAPERLSPPGRGGGVAALVEANTRWWEDNPWPPGKAADGEG